MVVTGGAIFIVSLNLATIFVPGRGEVVRWILCAVSLVLALILAVFSALYGGKIWAVLLLITGAALSFVAEVAYLFGGGGIVLFYLWAMGLLFMIGGGVAASATANRRSCQCAQSDFKLGESN